MGVPFINFKNDLYTAEVSINFGIIQPWNLRSTLRNLANRSSGSSSGNEFLIYANKIKA